MAIANTAQFDGDDEAIAALRDSPAWLCAEALLYLLQAGHPRRNLARWSGWSATQVRHHLRVAQKIVAPVKALWRNGQLQFSHLRVIAGYPPHEQETLARQTIAQHLSVHRLEKMRTAKKEEFLSAETAQYYRELAEKIGTTIGHPVSIAPQRNNPNAGTLAITYANLDMFDAICDRLRVPLSELM